MRNGLISTRELIVLRIRQRWLFSELCHAQPELRGLAGDVRRERTRARTRESYCANEVWYGRFKPRLERLVGWWATPPTGFLRSEEAYDAAYETLYAMLPDCRNCTCLGRIETETAAAILSAPRRR